MNTNSTSRFILHVSDFHLTDDEEDIKYAQDALKTLVEKLKSEHIKVDYLVHTGDVINSSDLYDKVARELSFPDTYFSSETDEEPSHFDEKLFCKSASEDEESAFNLKLEELTIFRFKKAEEILRKFISDLNIPLGNVVICSGNHDVVRYISINKQPITCEKTGEDAWEYKSSENLEKRFIPFEEFLDNLEVANSKKRLGSSNPIMHCCIDNLNFLFLNTNWKNPQKQKQGYFCVRCDMVNSVIDKLSSCDTKSNSTLNIILAHKPLYEICEKTRLSYQRYIQTPFMSNLRKFVGKNGIYLCGDKHTRSIVGSQFHDIPHYIGGEPLRVATNREVEYNLLELSQGKLGMERKIHLTHQSEWICDIRPQDAVVSQIYELSKEYIIDKAFGIIGIPNSSHSWETICQETYDWEKVRSQPWYDNLNKQYHAICKYRDFGSKDQDLDGKDVFDFVCEQLKEQIGNPVSRNALNIRGEYSSGKSTFLGLFFIYLLNQYSVGKINFIPAYFNLENKEISKNVKKNVPYFEAVRQAFRTYSEKIQEKALKEHQDVYFIIDGLDEQDCWSYSTEDSVGRALLNVLSEYCNAWYVMAFSQHRLPCFKNTMPARKYNDISHIMYFNPIDVREKGAEDERFISFMNAFLNIQKSVKQVTNDPSKQYTLPDITDVYVEQICDIVRNFRRLTITPGFMYDNMRYIIEQDDNGLKHARSYVSDIYNYYIDKQYEKCLDELGYNFVNYAPAMAYLFSFKGYTYEKFKNIHRDNAINHCHTLKSIQEYRDQIYQTFLFIKKNRDAREYLIALHYNRELRYYAENPDVEIAESSILCEFISRNIAVLIRKLWTDTNKFLIACEILLEREKLPASMQSILVYCLAHLQMYAPIRDQLRQKMQKKGEDVLKKKGCSNWVIEKEDSVSQLTQFIDLGLKHSITLFSCIDSNNSVELVNRLLSDEEFRKYNRQYQMLYYEDLSIKGEETRRALHPEDDWVYKGFDFHNCFHYLYVKLISPHSYPLREFDMFTLWDLICSRLRTNTLSNREICEHSESFFYREEERLDKRAKMVLMHTLTIFKNYTSKTQSSASSTVFLYFERVRDVLEKIVDIRNVKSNCYEEVKAELKEFEELIDKQKEAHT